MFDNELDKSCQIFDEFLRRSPEELILEDPVVNDVHRLVVEDAGVFQVANDFKASEERCCKMAVFCVMFLELIMTQER